VTAADAVLCVGECEPASLRNLLAQHGLQLVVLATDAVIPGSYWGEREAGLSGNQLFARLDTPLHSLLHEAAHYICMDETRRRTLHRDAGGDEAEECAVCYLQIVLADAVPECGRQRMWQDMDAWGYSFRLGSACAWFEQEAQDARQWLEQRGLLDEVGESRPVNRAQVAEVVGNRTILPLDCNEGAQVFVHGTHPVVLAAANCVVEQLPAADNNSDPETADAGESS
jgi:hypothetical protein